MAFAAKIKYAAPAAALAAAALLLEGCSFITIAFCPELKIPHGKVQGTWQHDAAVVMCDDGYQYLGEEPICDVYDQHCSSQGGKEQCHSRVGLMLRSHRRKVKRTGVPRMGSAPEMSTVVCTSVRANRAPAGGVEAWVRHFFQHWNGHKAEAVAADLAPAKGAANASLGLALTGALPHSSFKVQGVHACSSRAALVELRVANNESNRTVNVSDLMEFDDDGLVTAKTRHTITKILQNVGSGQGQGSLKVSGLPTNGNDLYLYKLFSPYGAIQSVKADLAEDGTCTGDGVVVFANAVDAQAARMKMDGKAPTQSVVDGHPDKDVVLHISVKIPGAEEEKTE